MRTPPLLEEHPRPLQIVLVFVVPALFGALTGYILGVSEPVYLIFSLIGVLGGIGAGYDHVGAKAGAGRGIIAGLVFGGSILIAHEIHGATAKAHLPEPAIILVVFTTVLGCVFGAIGGWLRARAMRGHEGTADPTPTPAPAPPPQAEQSMPTQPPPAAPPVQAAPAQPAAAGPTKSAPTPPRTLAPGETVSLTSGTFDDYRAMGMSVTQAKRVVAYREQGSGYSSVDDLDNIPGFSQQFLAEMKRRLVV